MRTISPAPAARVSAKCVHYWLVNPPDGATSWARCRHCGKRRRFTNRFEGRDHSNNSDLFVETAQSWRPDRRVTYYAPAVAEAYEAVKLAGLTA